MSKQCKWVALPLFILVLTQALAVAADEAISLEEVRKAVHAYESQLKSVSGTFELQIKETGAIQVYKVSPTVNSVTVQFVCDFANKRARYDEMSRIGFAWISEDGTFDLRQITTFDGEQSRQLKFTHSHVPISSEIPTEVPMDLFITADDLTAKEYGPSVFSALQLRRSATESLADILDHPETQIAGMTQIGEADCIAVEAPGYQFWLDPDRSFLPRKIVVPSSRTELREVFVIDEFRQFDDGQGSSIWFPVSGTANSWILKHSFQITDLKLNVEVADSQFQIDIESLPEGVRIVRDNWEIEFTGGTQDAYAELLKKTEALNLAIEEKHHPSSTAVNAPPQKKVSVEESTIPWSLVLAAVAGSILLMAVVAVVLSR